MRVFPLDLAFLRYLAGSLLFSLSLLGKNLCKYCLSHAYIFMPLTVHIFLFYLPWSQKTRGLDRFDCSKSRFLDRKRPTKGLVRKMQILSLDEIRQNELVFGVSLGVLSRSLACFGGLKACFVASHGFSFLRDGFGIRSGWSRNLCQKCQKIAPHDSKNVPNEQQNGHMTLVGSEPKEIQS